MPCTPAMASGLTDHQWSMFELLSYKVAPPALLIPKQRGRSSTKSLLDSSKAKPKSQKARVRLRKGALCSTTV